MSLIPITECPNCRTANAGGQSVCCRCRASAGGLTTEFSLRRGKDVNTVPSTAMLASCPAIGVLFQHYWIGALGAIFAVAAERFSLRVATVWDDHLNVVAASLAVMGALVKSDV